GALFLVVRKLHGYIFSGLTAQQIEELGRGLEELGYERKEDVDGFAYFVRKDLLEAMG
ncbi:unnamed protein product, partial [marine sediment metagenome]